MVEDTHHTDRAEQLIPDNNFAKGGYYLMDTTETSGRAVVDTLTWRDDVSPEWYVAQWGTDYDLAGTSPERRDDGAVEFSNESKTITSAPSNSEDGELRIEVRGSKEWDAPRPSRVAQWPNVLIEQQFREDVPTGAERPADTPANPETGTDSALRLDSMEALPFSITSKINFVEGTAEMAGDAFDPDLHTAQFQIFLTVTNVARDSPNRGDFMWFGLPLYDHRHPEGTDGYAQSDHIREGDKGTEKFIYIVASDDLGDESPAPGGGWVEIHRDVLPLIETGLETAFDRGYFPGSDRSEFAVTGMNMGWEVPGMYDVSAQVRDLSLVSVYSE